MSSPKTPARPRPDFMTGIREKAQATLERRTIDGTHGILQPDNIAPTPAKAPKAKPASPRERAQGRYTRPDRRLSNEENQTRKEQVGAHAARLLGVDPATLDPEERQDILINLRVNDYFLAALVNAADREGTTTKGFIKEAVLDRARRLGLEV